jgi:hypothetical protein
MVGVPRVFRSCIDSFASDLIAIAKEIAAEELSRALVAHQKDSRQAEKSARRADREARRAEKLAARAERAELRRKEKDRTHAEKEAARLERAAERRRQREARRLSLGFDPVNEAKRRNRRSAEPKNGAASPPSPPPLFVHKRRRDGQIQALTRPADEVDAPANAPPAAAAAPA